MHLVKVSKWNMSRYVTQTSGWLKATFYDQLKKMSFPTDSQPRS